MKNKFLASICVIILYWGVVVLASSNEDLKIENSAELAENAENVCIDQKVKNQIINTTFIQTQSVAHNTWCFKVPPRCRVYKDKLVTRWREENVTRVVNVRSCCPGFEPDGQGQCQAICEKSCGIHGKCVEPNVCRCNPGFSGDKCDKAGCPDGNWGTDCSRPCPCRNGGRCEPHTGQCLCPPGWKGIHCQNSCDQDKFGLECTQQCNCSLGQRCHHVSGECLPCSPGTYGARCAQNCQCSQNGTALCLHTTGQCFCSPNYYGNSCELYCPFGYVDQICYTKPIEPPKTYCVCPTDQMTCDQSIGCICKKDGDCGGGQRLLDLASAAPLEEQNQDSNHGATVAIVLSVLFLAITTIVLIAIYYRRRLKRMKTDLQNRSVYYVENSILDPARHHQHHDVVITDRDPLDDDLAIQSDPAIAMANHIANNLPNNAHAITNNVKHEKNVNIDRFKLGNDNMPSNFDQDFSNANAAGDCSSSSRGACALQVDEIEQEENNIEILEEHTISEPKNINVFDAEESPSKVKNNFLLEKQEKITKANVDLVFNRNDWKTKNDEETENPENLDEDEIAIAKMTTYLKHN